MKKIVLCLMLVVGLNANEMVKNILENVLIKNVNLAIKDANELEKSLHVKGFLLKQTKDDFSKLVYSWKKVQATYIGGDLNEDLLDTVRFIDIYHEGNENIHEQLERIKKSKENLDVELFKNSHKSINALEFILYGDTKLSQRDINIAQRIVKSIKSHLQDIKDAYKNDTKKLFKNEKFANSAILNALVANSYKTYSWRLAEGLGLSKKYNKKDKNRFEYAFSKQSVQALKGIVDAHLQMVDAKYEDFGDMAIKSGAKDEINELRELLHVTKRQLQNLKEEDLLGDKGKKLYDKFKQIYISYGLYLVSALEVTAKIVEADGD